MVASLKEIVFITGGNAGIGREVVRKLVRDHGNRFHVIIGCRTLSKGQELVKQLHDEGQQGVEALQVNITSEESLMAVANTVGDKFGKVDVLHVNAGICPDVYNPDRNVTPLSEVIKMAMETNVAGSAATVEHFIPLLSKAEVPRIIFMTSGAGSMQVAHDFYTTKRFPAYCASKAAKIMMMLYYYHRFPDWKVNACNPGFRATGLNDFGKGETESPGPVEQGAINAVRLSLLGKDGESGTHTQMQGESGVRNLPW